MFSSVVLVCKVESGVGLVISRVKGPCKVDMPRVSFTLQRSTKRRKKKKYYSRSSVLTACITMASFLLLLALV